VPEFNHQAYRTSAIFTSAKNNTMMAVISSYGKQIFKEYST
jgi:hypothetical protein